MTTTTNSFAQPIGCALPDWQTRDHPAGAKMAGRFCRLEPINLAHHGSELFEAFSQDKGANWTYMPYGPFAQEGEFFQWLESTCLGSDPCFFAIIDEVSQKAVGVASYLRIDPVNGVIEVGHIHFSPSIQGTLIASEAMYLMMQQAFEVMGYRRYEWKCDSLNQSSCAAARRLGFIFEGIFRQAVIYKGRNRDTAWFAMTDQDWLGVKTIFQSWLSAENFDADGQQLTRLSVEIANHLGQ